MIAGIGHGREFIRLTDVFTSVAITSVLDLNNILLCHIMTQLLLSIFRTMHVTYSQIPLYRTVLHLFPLAYVSDLS